ncbi:MAG: tetratricopeptide repeat protein, partial [Lutibacter sp.]
MKKILILSFALFQCFIVVGQFKDKFVPPFQKIEKDTITPKIKIALKAGRKHDYSNKDSAYFYYNKALEISVKYNKINEIGLSYFNIAFLQLIEKKFAESIESFNKGLVYFNQVNNELYIAKTYNNLGYCYDNLNVENKAITYLIKSLNLFKKLKNDEGIVLNYNDLGNLFYYKKNYNYAEKYYLKSLNFHITLKDSLKIANDYINLGNTTSDAGNLKKGFQYYTNAITILKKHNDKYGLATVYNNIGDSYKVLKQYSKAKIYYNKSLTLNTQLKDDDLFAIIYINKAELAHKVGYPLMAINYAKKSNFYANKVHNIDYKIENFNTISLAYKTLNNYELAYFYNIKYTKLKDSLNDIAQNRTVQIFNAINTLEQSDQQVNKLSSENTKIKRRNEVDKKFIYVLIIFLILIASLLFVLNIQFTKKHETN